MKFLLGLLPSSVLNWIANNSFLVLQNRRKVRSWIVYYDEIPLNCSEDLFDDVPQEFYYLNYRIQICQAYDWFVSDNQTLLAEGDANSKKEAIGFCKDSITEFSFSNFYHLEFKVQLFKKYRLLVFEGKELLAEKEAKSRKEAIDFSRKWIDAREGG